MRECEACGLAFESARKGVRFCKDPDCRKARANSRHKKWRDHQPRSKFNERQQEYRGRTSHGRDWELRNKYGITLEQWASMVSYVDSKCEICGERVDNPCVDHDHVTGEVRGVLCRSCNRSIGQLGDSTDGLQRAVDYLRKAELGRNVPGASSSHGEQGRLF